MRWQMQRVRVLEFDPLDHDALDALLAEGWEPFSVIDDSGNGGWVYHLRRQTTTDVPA